MLTVPPFTLPSMYVSAEEFTVTEVVPVMSFVFMPAPSSPTTVPEMLSVTSSCPSESMSTVPPFTLPSMYVSAEEFTVTEVVPVRFFVFISAPSIDTSVPVMSPFKSTFEPVEFMSTKLSDNIFFPCASSTPAALISTLPASIAPFKSVFSVYELIVSAFCALTPESETP